MSLIRLANELNLTPKRTASTNGGEYHCPCPKCGGDDRFMIWEQAGRYFCRQCDAKGDAIQFCRDFMGLDFKSACLKLGIEKQRTVFSTQSLRPRFSAIEVNPPPFLWQKKASQFVVGCHENLLKSECAIQLLKERGFFLETMNRYFLGWHPHDEFLTFSDWGLPIAYNEKGKERKLWLPQGLVIPTFSNSMTSKLKIRRSAWKEEDKYPKYVEVSGSMKTSSIYGNKNDQPILLVEAEFDAMLIQQFGSDLCCSIAIGGAGKKPDKDVDNLLRNSKVLLFCLDFDEAGKKAFRFWKETYPHLKPWPAPRGKSPEASLKEGTDLRSWIKDGISLN